MTNWLTLAKEAFAQGKPVLLMDDEERENEADLIFPAEIINTNVMAMMIRECSGIVCLVLTEAHAKKLDLPLMIAKEHNTSRRGTNFTVSIEAMENVTTGVSAADRVTTIRAAMAANAKPSDLARPGHVFPLIAHPGGIKARNGHTEGSLHVVKACGYQEAAVLCELMNPDGAMARFQEAALFAKTHGLPLITMAQISA